MMPSVICSVSRMRFPCDPHIDVATIIFFFVVLLLAATSRLLIGRLEKHFNFQPTKKEDALLPSSFLHYEKAYSIPPIQIGQILNRNIPSLFQGIVPQNQLMLSLLNIMSPLSYGEPDLPRKTV